MKSNVTPLLLIVLSVGLFYLYINPQYTEINTLNAKEAEYSNALDKAQQIQQIRANLLTKYNNFSQENMQKLQTLLPDNVDNVRLALDLANVAKKYNIDIKDIKIDKPLNDLQAGPTGQIKPYGEAKVTFSFSASYENFVKYVMDIEQSLRIVDVSGISFKAPPSGMYDYTLVVNTYWLK